MTCLDGLELAAKEAGGAVWVIGIFDAFRLLANYAHRLLLQQAEMTILNLSCERDDVHENRIQS